MKTCINIHGMTVKELINFLKKTNPSARIIVEDEPEGYSMPLVQAEFGAKGYENRVKLMAYLWF